MAVIRPSDASGRCWSARMLAAALCAAACCAGCGKLPWADGAPAAPREVGPWEVRSTGQVSRFWQVIWDGQMFLAVGGRKVLISGDGIVWESITTPATGDLFGIARGGGRYVAVGDAGAIISSPDARTWISHPQPTPERIYTVMWTGAQFFAYANHGQIFTSPDGLSWKREPSNYGGHGIHQGVWTGKEFVLSGFTGVLTSPDGLRWRVVVRSPLRLFDVAWSGSQFVAVGGSDPVVWISPDAVTWSAQATGTTAGVTGITWAGNQFVAVGGKGSVLTSHNGVTWKESNAGVPVDLWDVASNGEVFVAVSGTDGTIISTRPPSFLRKLLGW